LASVLTTGFAQHDIGRALSLSQKFYVAQRCGDLPDNNRSSQTSFITLE
jgi:hypothetical protein